MSKNAIRVVPLLVLLFIISSVYAQLDENQFNNQLSVQLVESRINQLGESDNVDDETLKAYKKAKNYLEMAALSEENTKRYLNALVSAPKAQQEIQEWVDSAPYTEPQIVDDVDELSNNELQAKLSLLRAQLATATNKHDDNERTLSARDANAQKITQRQEEIRNRLNQVPSDPVAVNIQSNPTSAEALSWQQAAERIALNAEQKALDSQLTSQPVRYDLLGSEQVKLEIMIEQLSSQIRLIEHRMIEILGEGSEVTGINVDESSPIYNIVEDIINERERFSEYRSHLITELDKINNDDDRLQNTIAEVEERQASISRIVEFAGDSYVLGNILLVHWREIKTFQILDSSRPISDAIGNTVIQRISYEELQEELANSQKYIQSLIMKAGLDSNSISEYELSVITDQVKKIREELGKTIKLQSEYLEALREHLRHQSQFSALIKQYQSYIVSRILWIPSHSPVYKSTFENIPNEIQDIYTSLTSLRLNKFPISAFFGLLVALILYISRRRLIKQASTLNRNIGTRKDSILFTFAALGLILVRASPIPLALWSLSYIFTSENVTISLMTSSRIQTLAIVIFLPLIIRLICEDNGVGLKHFKWSIKTCVSAIKTANLWLFWWIPIFAVSSVFIYLRIESYDTVLDQLVSIGIVLYVAVYIIYSMIHTGEKLSNVFEFINRHRIQSLFLVLAMGVLLGLIAGYVYTARTLAMSILNTFWLTLFLVLMYNILKRWLLISQRKIQIAEYKAKLEEVKDGELHQEEDREALADISLETAKLLKVGVGVIAFVMLWYIWKPLLPALEALQRVTLWSTTATLNGENITTQITLTSLLLAIAIAVLTIYAAGKIPALIEFILRRRTTVSASASYTLSTLLNYIIIGIGLFAVLSELGLNWSKLQWLVAALGVGIGFGLQEIVANFISGLIILFERPIRVGDVVTTGNNEGTVTRIRIRATTIVDWDGKELLVPNKEFITGRVLNWTLSNSSTRILINVGVAYGSDITKALEILKEVISSHARVLDDPAPAIIFTDFGDNSLNLSARAFIDSMENRLGVVSELNQNVYKRFEEAGIVIAFPQRDIHLDSENPIQVSIQSTNS